MKRRLYSFLTLGALGGAFSLSFTYCGPLLERKVSGTVLALEGSAMANRLTELSAGSFIRTGDVLTTAEGTRASLMLVPGVLVEINGAVEMVITQLHLERDGNETVRPMTARDATIVLRRGRLVATVDEAQTDPSLTIETPWGVITSGPSQTFEVTASENQLRVFCVRGVAVLHPPAPAAVIEIPAGSFAEFPPFNQKPRWAADAGAAAQKEVTALLRVEKRLLRLQDDKESLFHP